MTPARRLVVLNGHGGNSALVGVANRELRLRHGLMTFLAHPGVPPDQGGPSAADELGMGVHGGADETSLVLHLAPELVDMTAARGTVPEHLAANRFVRFGGTVSFGWLSNDFDDSGVHRRPHRRDRRARRRAVRRRVTAFASALGEIAAFEYRGAR